MKKRYCGECFVELSWNTVFTTICNDCHAVNLKAAQIQPQPDLEQVDNLIKQTKKKIFKAVTNEEWIDVKSPFKAYPPSEGI